MREIVCPPAFNDRLDRALPRLFDGLSRTQARKLIAAGAVFVDGRRCRVASRAVADGSRLRIEEAPQTEAPPLPILYEDERCIAIDKPPSMPSAPTMRAASGTALDELREQLRRRDGRNADLWLVHRLDAGTSGVLLFARTRAAVRNLDALFRERRVEKEYVAWVAGDVAEDAGSIDVSLRASGSRTVVDAGGRAALTAWEVIERRGDRTLVRLRPATGRMHQLRVHMQSIGHPVVGDRLYGGPAAPRLLLHAARLRLPSPSGVLDIEAPLPSEFA